VSVPPTRGTVARYGATRAQVATMLDAVGEPSYRVTQVWDALYSAGRPLSDATVLPRRLRNRLDDALPLALDPVTEVVSRDGMTTKWLWGCRADGCEIETVLMRSPSRATVCVSSQAGCAMGCTFCATGQAGFERHLETGEIVEQVARAAHACPTRVSNVVFMGMGEPLANYDAVWAAVERMHDDLGVSARRITVSTVGVVPSMRRLARERLPVTLAVSLHAADDVRRDELVPLNRRYPIAEVLDAAADFAGAHGRRVTFEYACIAGVNDASVDAEALGRLLSGFPGAGGAHVNLIPLNPTDGFSGRASGRSGLRDFVAVLRTHGVAATVRRNRGVDIAAACGQLRRRGAILRGVVPSARMST
jgi:23S rRNA (adenine2503-C2)-methyltransferase